MKAFKKMYMSDEGIFTRSATTSLDLLYKDYKTGKYYNSSKSKMALDASLPNWL
jgi:hypothetical protein